MVFFCEMVILVVFKGFLMVKNLEILTQIVPDRSIYSYWAPPLKFSGRDKKLVNG